METAFGYQKIFVALHTGLIYTWTILATFIMGLTAILVSFFSKTGDSVHLVARWWGRALLWACCIPIRVEGMQHIQPNRSCIYMSNHQSNFDIPVLLSKLPVQFRWLAKAELFKIPIFGRGMRGAGYISIDRSNRKSAFQSLARAAESIRNGTSVLIFPEGTRSRDGHLHAFKKGGFVLAVDAGVPIVPIVIQGTYAMMPKDSRLIRRQTVRVEIKPPIETAGFNRRSKDALMEQVWAVMAEHLPAASGGPHA
jgi:1-acyl-sn-glycerol-3-phosphate acyltransferase